MPHNYWICFYLNFSSFTKKKHVNVFPILFLLDLQKQIQKKTDELEIYGKRYKSMKNMLKKCKESSYKPPSYSNSSTQKKYGFIKRGYNGGYCTAFNYAGCGGNQNKFDSKRKCQKFCRGYRLPKKCKLRIKKGRPCKPYEAPPY